MRDALCALIGPDNETPPVRLAPPDMGSKSGSLTPRRTIPSPSDTPALARRVRQAWAATRRRIVVMIDEVTGSQVVDGSPVLVDQSAAAIATELLRNPTATVLLTDTRELAEDQAASSIRRLAADLVAAAHATRSDLTLLHRLDPLLAGHVVAETQAIADRLGGFDGVLLVPAFLDAGYYTIDATQWVRTGDHLVPLAGADLAGDPRFPVDEPDLRRCLEARSGGALPAGSVGTVTLAELRGGHDRLARRLGDLRDGQYVVVDTATMDDLYHLLLACVDAERNGARLLYRPGPSFMKVCTARDDPKPLRSIEIFGAARANSPGLLLLGPLTSRNATLRNALRQHPSVLDLVIEPEQEINQRGQLLLPHHFRHLSDQLGHALAAGLTPLLSFSTRSTPHAPLPYQQACGRVLSELVRSLTVTPRWILVESGVIAGAVTRHGLEIRRAEILGQPGPGITAWRLDTESRMSKGILAVVTPGVADPRTIARLIP